jgi:hypothetical protein
MPQRLQRLALVSLLLASFGLWARGARAQEPVEAPDGVSLPLLNLRVSGSVLRPRTSTDGITINTSGGCIYNVSGSAFGVLNVPLDLPNGATVNTLRMYYFDTSASDSTGWFTVYDLYGDVVTEVSVQSSGSSGNSFNDSALINHVIDHSVHSYVLNWRPTVAGNTMQLCGFRIFYNPPLLFADGFESGNTSQWSTTVQ